MKTYKNIIIDTNKHLGLLTLSRQEENNSLNIDISKEIYEGLKELEQNRSVRIILIQSNQKHFSPGADIKELSQLNSSSAKAKGLFNFFDLQAHIRNIADIKYNNLIEEPLWVLYSQLLVLIH